MFGRWQNSRDSGPEGKQRWLIALIVAAALQVPLGLAIVYLIDRSVSDIEFKQLAGPTTVVLEPHYPLDEPFEIDDSLEDDEVEPEELPDEIDGTEDPVGQIVTVVPVDKEEMPDKARFAARYAIKVKEETKARKPSKDQDPPRKWDEKTRAEKRPSVKKGNPDRLEMTTTDRAGTQVAGEGVKKLVEGGPESKGLPGQLTDGLAVMQPHMGGLDPVTKYSPSTSPYSSDDYIPDVEKEGETNLLNTIPYRYVGFFERVKRRVRQHWDPNRIYRLRDPGGEMYGHKDRYTVLSIVLDQKGYLLDASIAGPSGLKFLDDEALRAFGAASPFLNPPSGLVKSDGKIRFDFGFAFLIASSRKQFFWRWQ